ncbi:thioredoxin family protein [Cochleicola gelatinilyticus]|uniref:Thioredoxin n=1 Tax=Cochleicola gelatinilyticus TaxID=1763537 RepID=A0A167F3D3_9FLAO|nr:thioredoxin family protein [Cochleicola gelatinilyticus]OAB76149.1 hypothetical protein ULVI_13920 [Cochleicola gelatinilyticus]
MKHLFCILLIVITSACNNSNKVEKETVEPVETASEKKSSLVTTNGINSRLPDTENNETVMMVGKANRKGLEKEPFKAWFDEGYKTYEPNEATINELKPLLKNVTIKAFMGTWCEDSQREIPHFYAIMDAANFNYDNLELVTMTHEKDTPQGFEKDLNIEFVPTLIFYRDGEELGRFVEYAQDSLENDILAIVSGKEYKHAYAE